jgi:hypothetical protein
LSFYHNPVNPVIEIAPALLRVTSYRSASALYAGQYLHQRRLIRGNEGGRGRDFRKQFQQPFRFPRSRGQVCREDHFWGNLTDSIQRFNKCGRLNHMNPRAVSTRPSDHALSQHPFRNIISITCRRCYYGAKTISREKDIRPVIVDADSGRVVEQRRSDGGQLAVTGADPVPRIQPVKPMHGHSPGGTHPEHSQ